MDTKNKYSGLGGTWNLIKDTAETPEEIREVVETMDRSKEYELERLKKQQIRMSTPGQGYIRPDGSKASYKEFVETNKPIRKRVMELLGDNKKVNEFMLRRLSEEE